MGETRIAIIGFGKIAREQHAPAISASKGQFRLAAVVTSSEISMPGVAWYKDYRALLDARSSLDAVAICTPPAARYDIARACLEAGLPVLLEKPPTITIGAIETLAKLAAERRLTLFATWHARFNAAVEDAAEIIRSEGLARLHIEWQEDVRKWHPDQQWIWEAGGFGVFDAGINAYSIATYICPAQLLVRSATLLYPRDRQAPVAATVTLDTPGGTGPLDAVFDWRHPGPEKWAMQVETTAGTHLDLEGGGARLKVNGVRREHGPGREYQVIYERFSELLRSGQADVDIAPLRLLADTFLVGERKIVPAETALPVGA